MSDGKRALADCIRERTYWKDRAEKAEAKCKRLREILQTLEKGGLEPWQSSQIARQALKDTKT